MIAQVVQLLWVSRTYASVESSLIKAQLMPHHRCSLASSGDVLMGIRDEAHNSRFVRCLICGPMDALKIGQTSACRKMPLHGEMATKVHMVNPLKARWRSHSMLFAHWHSRPFSSQSHLPIATNTTQPNLMMK